MPLLTSPDGRYTFAMETAGEGDSNSVVYDRGRPVWDRWSYEAGLASLPTPDIPAQPPLPFPPVSAPSPLPSASPFVRVTTEADGEIEPRQYSYWPCAYAQGEFLFVLAGLKRDGYVHMFRVEVDQVMRMGPFTHDHSTGEGRYWDAVGRIVLPLGSQLIRRSPFIGTQEVLGDISQSHPGHELIQVHSSDDGTVHSATVVRRVESGKYPAVGTIVFFSGGQAPYYTQAEGNLDESHLSGDGQWLVMEENNNNRVVHLPTQVSRLLLNREGALSHIDCGPDFMVGEDDQHEPGACVRWDFNRPFAPENRQLLYSSGVWGGQGMGHVSVQAGTCLLSTAEELLLVPLDGSRVITTIGAHGMVGDKANYDLQVKASLTRDGSAYCFMSNMGGPRQDVYVGYL